MSTRDDIANLGCRGLMGYPIELGEAVCLAAQWDAERPIYYIGSESLISATGYLYAVGEMDQKLRGVQGSVIVRDLDSSRDPARLLGMSLNIANSARRGCILIGTSSSDSSLGAQLIEGQLFQSSSRFCFGQDRRMLLWYRVSGSGSTVNILARGVDDARRRLDLRTRSGRATTLERAVYGGGNEIAIQIQERQIMCSLCDRDLATHLLRRPKLAPGYCCASCGTGQNRGQIEPLYEEGLCS